jgi:hypothetical protein
VIFLIGFKLNVIPDHLDLPPLPLSSTDEITNEEPLEDWNQRHRQDEKNAGNHREIKQKRERRIYLPKDSLKPGKRVRPQCIAQLLNGRMNNGNVVLPAEERGDREAAPAKSQRLKGFLARRFGFLWQLIWHDTSSVLFKGAFHPAAAVRPCILSNLR